MDFRKVFDLSPLPIMVLQDHHIRLANPKAALIFGLTMEELARIPFAELIHPKDRRKVLKAVQDRPAGEEVVEDCDFRALCRRGEIYLRGFISPVEYGGHPAVMCQLMDLTDQKRIEEVMWESEGKYKELFENANDIIYTHDFQGNFTSLNAVALKTYGYTLKDLPRLSIREVVDSRYLPRAEESIRLKVENNLERTDPYELLTYTKNGLAVWVEVNTRLIRDKGRPVGILGIARDITERKRAEEALQQSEKNG